MPEVGKEIIKRLNFPEYPADDPGWIDILCNPKRELFLGMNEVKGDTNAYMLAQVIRDWNFTRSGQKLEITQDNVSAALSMVDQVMALDAIGLTSVFSDIKKNNSVNTSLPKKEAPPGNTSI